MLRILLVVCAILLAAVTIAVGAAYFTLRPNEFKVAVPATDPIDQRLFGLAADMLRSQRAPIRIEVVPVEKSKDALEALEAEKVNLAVVRSDGALVSRTHTVMIMRREAAVIVAPKTGKMQKIADLENATIGVTREGPIDGSLLAPVLDYYGITRDKARNIALQGDDIADAFRQKKIDAMIAVGPVTSKQMGEAIADAARGIKGAIQSAENEEADAIQFIEIEEADAIVKRIPALESIEIEQGAFGGRPPRPAESFNTIGYSIRLVTNTTTDTDSIAELARQLFLIRQNLSAAIPGAGLMETPDVDEATPYLIHPGVRAYLSGEQRSWFDKYNDYIYLGLFVAGGIGSIAAGMFGWLRSGKSRGPQLPREGIERVFDAVRDAQTSEQLDAAEREADEIFRSVFTLGVEGKLSGDAIASFNLATNELRSRIAARRAALKAG